MYYLLAGLPAGWLAPLIIFFVPILPYFLLDDNCSMTRKLAASLHFNVAFAFGCKQIYKFEKIGMQLCMKSITTSEKMELKNVCNFKITIDLK